ncbi:MAG: hypothetical protein WB524_21540 [Acidobacteriaceae bacterium]
MNLRHLCDRIVSSVLAIGIGLSLAGLGAHSASAQSLTVTTPFSYCVNRQAYPRGEYQFTLLSEWLLDIRNVKNGKESLLLVQPEVYGVQKPANGAVVSVGELTFRSFQGFRELQTVRDPVAGVTVKVIGRGTGGDRSKSGRLIEPVNCLTERDSIGGRTITGQ